MREDTEELLIKRAEEIIYKHFYTGIQQDAFIEKLGVGRERAKEIISMLVKRGIIERQRLTLSNKKTTVLYPKNAYIHVPVSLNLISQTPCFWCKNLLRCRTGSNPDPAGCTILEEWLLRRD